MEAVLNINNYGFAELSQEQMFSIEAGGLLDGLRDFCTGAGGVAAGGWLISSALSYSSYSVLAVAVVGGGGVLLGAACVIGGVALAGYGIYSMCN